ncbi:MAG: hypothetical protein KatS3mg103_0231 [Phycisphaerales bacterium]|nr:MAG: hypothetical protein KatS3mg103_0231 [Phycisphaerales bacterium]
MATAMVVSTPGSSASSRVTTRLTSKRASGRGGRTISRVSALRHIGPGR